MAGDRRGIVLFVHGFGSSSKCWAPLLGLLGGDEAITSRYELRTWDYPTKWVELNVLGRIPRLQELGRSLGDEIDSPAYRGRPLTLVGHSQGGLVILSYLADVLARGEASRLSWLRQAVCVATPCEGSTTAMSLRAIASALFRNPQELTLRVLNPDVSDMRAVIRERVVTATRDNGVCRRVPIHAICGLQDNIVPEASARGPFESVRRVPGDHFSILRPPDRRDRRYTELTELLLDPGGHLHRFEIEQYETVIRVEPRPEQTIVTKSERSPRTVEFDNYATLTRTVTFAASNRCRNPFTIKYGTRKDGYVVGHESHQNEAPAAEIGRGEDTGEFYQFDFTPEYGQEYCLNVEVYRGFDPGERDVHFHLGDHSHYRRLVYVLDLSRYVAAGYKVSEGPHFYLQPEDVPHGAMCRNRGARAPRPPASATAEGVYRWEIEDIEKGVVDIVWDVAACVSSLPEARPLSLATDLLSAV
jgi:pimeloyl-ACP methyl ester carboxylesterase